MDKKVVLVPPNSSADAHAPTHAELTGADLYWVWSSSVSEIPARLDIDKLRAALSKTLAVYRPACGRIRKNSATDWKVVFTDSPLPFEIVECTNLPQFDDSVWQAHEPVGSLLPDMKCAPHEVINTDSPLVSLKATSSADKTVLGITWHHAIGDDTTRFRFMSHLSRYYQGLDPLYPLPSFARHHFFNPDTQDARSEDDSAFIRGLGGTPEISMEQVAQIVSSSNVVVRWLVPRSNANVLRANIQRGLDLKVSIQDCLSAYVASAVHQCGHDIRRINCGVAFRGLCSDWGKENVAGNLVSMASTGIFEDACDPRQFALKIRQTIRAFREAEFVEIMRKTEQFISSSTEQGNWNPMFAAFVIPNTLTLNGMAALTWQESVNFGHPRAKYYAAYHAELPYYVRIHPANPTMGRSASDAFEVMFSVPKSIHSKVLEKLGEKNYLSPFN